MSGPITIRVSEVRTNGRGRARAVDPLKVADLAASIAEVGLLNPITVAPDYTLAAGRHRLEAHRSLGLAEIPAVVVPFEDAELARIDENLMRSDLTVLQQGQHLLRREEILRERGVRAKASPGTNQHTRVVGETVSPTTATTAAIARQAGLSERSAQQRAQIAREIAPDVQDALADTDVADSTRQLLDIARMPEEEQRAVVDLVATGQARDVKDARRQVVTGKRQQEAEERVAAASTSGAHPFAPDIVHTDVLAGLAGIETDTADLVVADPPYNIGKAEWDKRPPADHLLWCAEWLRECIRILKPTGALYVFGYPRGLTALLPMIETGGLVYRDWIVWDTIMGTGGGLWVNRHEDILYFSKSRDTFEDADAIKLERHEENIREYRGVEYRFKNPSNIWRFPRIDDSAAERTNHPTQKPLALIERIVRASSPAGGLVVDPFVGSGTTCVAAMRQQRRSIGIDNDPDNITIARARIAAECAL